MTGGQRVTEKKYGDLSRTQIIAEAASAKAARHVAPVGAKPAPRRLTLPALGVARDAPPIRFAPAVHPVSGKPLIDLKNAVSVMEARYAK